MPQPDRVNLVLGQGAGATQRFIREEILSRFKGRSLAELEDSGILSLAGHSVAISTDSYVIDPPLFPGGNIGHLAVTGTVNDLVATGARPVAMTVGLILGEGFPWDKLRIILDSIAHTSESVGIEIVAGDTKVLAAEGFGICINTTGIGIAIDSRQFRLGDSQESDTIIVSGSVGNHEIALLSDREGLGFEQRVLSDAQPLSDLILPLLSDFRGIRALRDPTRGGVAGVLLDLAEATACDVLVGLHRIPIKMEVAAACEMLGLSPLDMINEGCMLLVVSPKEATPVLERLQAHPLGREATIIGELARRRSARPVVIQVESDGRERVLLRTDGHPYPRLC